MLDLRYVNAVPRVATLRSKIVCYELIILTDTTRNAVIVNACSPTISTIFDANNPYPTVNIQQDIQIAVRHIAISPSHAAHTSSRNFTIVN